MKLLFTQQPFKSQKAIYIAAGCIHKTVIYTAAIQEPTRLYTLLQVYIHEIVIYTAAVQEPKRLYTLLPGV